jgi:hypothetical protein
VWAQLLRHIRLNLHAPKGTLVSFITPQPVMITSTVPNETKTAMEEWSREDHTFYYPDRDTTKPALDSLLPTALVGRNWDATTFAGYQTPLSDQLKKLKRQKKSLILGNFPLKGKLADLNESAATRQTIMTNHFKLKMHATTLYEYEILDLDLGSPTRKKVQALFRRAIEQWPFLSSERDSSATDGQKMIVSWKRLHSMRYK